MKGKKLLSMVTAGSLAMAMAMPAAASSGELTVNVTTKGAILRVQVPTKMVVAVDQYMMSGDGTQISSEEFTMENKSAVDVKVSVASTVTLGTQTTLVDTKAKADESMKAGEAWLAVAAKTAAASYDDSSTSTETETIANLTESNTNVATFGTENKQASQTFYLKKGATAAYKLKNASETLADEVYEYAQFYELTAETLSSSDDDGVKALIAANPGKDIYVAAAAAANGQELTLLDKKNPASFASGQVYYTASLTPVEKKNDVDSSNLYVYSDTSADADKGNAAFRYIGVLSDGQDAWSSEDISTIKIEYTIVGVSPARYEEVADDCHYGLYTSTVPSIDYDGATPITLVKGSTSVYQDFSKLKITAADIKNCVVKVGDADYTPITQVSSTTALKFNIDSSWSSASSVKIYVITDEKVYVYTYK